MAKPSIPKVVISIPHIATYFVVGCLLIYGAKLSAQPTNNRPLQSLPAATHQTVITTPPPAVPLQPVPVAIPATDSVATIASTKATVPASGPHSTQPAPVVTPAPSASVSGLAPVDPTPASTPPGTSPSPAPAPAPVTNSYTSTNWAGYLATTGTYTAVSGSWVVPNATGVTGRTSYDATWIGIGGVTADDLIQVGTANTISSKGHETSVAFYELLPDASRTITSLTVAPGDTMNASLTEVSTGQWTVTIADTTTGKSYATTVNYASSHSSAEWIEEDPNNIFNKLLPLGVFAPVAFASGTTASGTSSLTIDSANAQPVTLVSGSDQPVATPSALGSDGQTFSITHS
jgi:hypothetical protein